MDELKNIILAGIGTAAYTYEKASDIIASMVEKGRLTVDEGKELSQELKRTISKENTSECRKKDAPVTREDIKELLQEMNFATKDDFNSIITRLENLEKNK